MINEGSVRYDFNIDCVANQLRKLNAHRILLQMPDGLKPYALSIASELEKRGFEVLISGSSCYGACDIADVEAQKVKADAIVHFGHYPHGIINTLTNVVFEPVKIILDNLDQLAETLASYLKGKGFKTVGLVANAQHVHDLPKLSQILQRLGIGALIDAETRGLILGCDVSAALSLMEHVDCIVFIGCGYFHPLGIALKADKPVILADPLSMRIEEVTHLVKRVEHVKWSAIYKARKAKVFGVITSLKAGQFNLDLALKAVNLIRKRGLCAYLITADEITWERLASFTEVEAFIVVGCPRIALDNRELFGKPIIDYSELSAILNA
ncbi:MAG: diphthamide biosynthesis enzyme Dph2 [Candidatus Methanomethylicota archaeon]|uniref:2-(3-amino-3-carboxypropyl)histidine synthase n=1 Tax=Thermoproteota archaeon TaxID=2056631 RepID=A0A497F3T3_9CREN|nr:MAG: diphthamide biosynthesis enzyme Dph2 [Candidatus Verstraetearchaeota archaeon]